MGYQPGLGRSGRPRGFDKQKKSKTKKAVVHHAAGGRRGESGAQTLDEVVNRTLSGLENVGAQTFATPPFHQHYDRWLKSLTMVLDDFETSPGVEIDERFHREREELQSAVEAALKSEHAKETERESKILSLRGSKDQLLASEGEHEAKLRELSARRGEKLKALSDTVDTLRHELDTAQGVKASFLERFTNKKAQKVAELESRIAAAESVLNSTKAEFDAEATYLQDEYIQKKRGILEKVAEERAVVEKIETEAQVDGSAELRKVTCEELSEAVKALIHRLESQKPPE